MNKLNTMETERRFKIITDFDNRLAKHPIGAIITETELRKSYGNNHYSDRIKELRWYEERELPFYVKRFNNKTNLIKVGDIITVDRYVDRGFISNLKDHIFYFEFFEPSTKEEYESQLA